MDGHGHGHDHGAAARAGARHQGRLGAALALTIAFLVVQVVVGAGHRLAGAALRRRPHGHRRPRPRRWRCSAIHVANRGGRDRQRTFGLYRLEILAALANAVLLFGVAGYVLVEAARRLSDPPEIASGVGARRRCDRSGRQPGLVQPPAIGRRESLNVEGAYLEVHGRHARLDRRDRGRRRDGAAPAGTWVDPVIGAAIGVFILPRAWRLGREALRILVQAAPAGTDLGAIDADLAVDPGRRRRARPPRVDAHVVRWRSPRPT